MCRSSPGADGGKSAISTSWECKINPIILAFPFLTQTRWLIMLKRILATTWLIVLAFSALTSCGGSKTASEAAPAYLDASLPVEQRVKDLLGRMPLAEKIGPM